MERARRTGLRAELHVRGEPRPLDETAERAAYRIVQESLTNVLRHAPQSAVTVTLAYLPDALTLTIENDGDPVEDGDRPGAGSGMGLIGMRERAVPAGGTVTAGPRPGGGWVVRGVIPA